MSKTMTPQELIALERVLNLNLLTDFEKDFLEDFKVRYELYGSRMVMSEKQRDVLLILNKRYMLAYTNP